MATLSNTVLTFLALNCVIIESYASDRFYYFGYGSNLLKNRMHINCKSAEFISNGHIVDYRLDFNWTVEPWGGAVATIAPQQGDVVWGALYSINLDELPKLDNQEGVPQHMYFRMNVTVLLEHEKTVEAISYMEYNLPKYSNTLPLERRPSRTYLKVIKLGAIDCGLPVTYLDKIDNFQDNGKLATCERRKKLGYPFYDKSVCS